MSINKKSLLFGLVIGFVLLFLPSWFRQWGVFTASIFEYFELVLPWIGNNFISQFAFYYFLATIVLVILKLTDLKINFKFYSLGVTIVFILFLVIVYMAVTDVEFL